MFSLRRGPTQIALQDLQLSRISWMEDFGKSRLLHLQELKHRELHCD